MLTLLACRRKERRKIGRKIERPDLIRCIADLAQAGAMSVGACTAFLQVQIFPIGVFLPIDWSKCLAIDHVPTGLAVSDKPQSNIRLSQSECPSGGWPTLRSFAQILFTGPRTTAISMLFTISLHVAGGSSCSNSSRSEEASQGCGEGL